MFTSNSSLSNNHFLDNWIKSYKPTSEDSKQIFETFVKKTQIQGSPEFVAKIRKIMAKAACLTTGSTIMQRVLATQKPIKIIQSNDESFYLEEENELNFEFLKNRSFDFSFNGQGEKELVKEQKVATFIHELIHKWHLDIDPLAATKRRRKAASSADMDDQEEELTMTGKLVIKGQKTDLDFCCENSALLELGFPECINHRCVTLQRKESLGLFDILSNRALGNLKKALNGHPQEMLKTPFDSRFGTQTPLHFAMHQNLAEEDPSIQKEWMEIIKLLIKAGFKSEYALKLAILENSAELVSLLLASGVKPAQEMLELAVHQSCIFYEVREILRKFNLLTSNLSGITKYPYHRPVCLEIVQDLLKAGCVPSPNTLQIAGRMGEKVTQVFIEAGIKFPP